MTTRTRRSTDTRFAATRSADWIATRPTITEDDDAEIESLPRALGIIVVVIAVIMLMSMMLNQYRAIDLTTLARTWMLDPGSTSGLAATATASSIAAPNISRGVPREGDGASREMRTARCCPPLSLPPDTAAASAMP